MIKDYHAIIAGGASGLGRATATHLAQQGVCVTILDRDEQAGQALASSLGAKAQFIGCDVTDHTGVSEAMAKAQQEFGALRLAVNCAGILRAARLLGKQGLMDPSLFEEVIKVNLIGAFLFNRAAADLMQHHSTNNHGERGVIVHTASIAAFEGQIGQVAYAASKAGVAGMVLPLARELARFGIRVMAIAPGLFATPMIEGLSDEAREALVADVPFPHRLGDSSEFATLVAHIAANPMLNGSVIRLDAATRLR